MRIGIVTLPPFTNYGGILQAYALSKVLQDMGHEVKVIYTPTNWRQPWYKFPLQMAKRFIKKYILGRRNTVFFVEAKLNREFPIVCQKTLPFIEKHIPRLKVNGYEDIQPNDFDAFLVGSDQVWRPDYFEHVENAFLLFAEGWKVKRIAYAASFGVDFWVFNKKQTKECKRLACMFDSISVREESGIELCKKYLDCSAEWVLDPTLLLTAEDYIHLFENTNTPGSKGNLLCYILDETSEKRSIINHIAETKSLVPFRVNSKIEDVTAPVEERIQPPVEQWLRGFYDADFIVTDSFHACVFSIIFKKQFVVLANHGRGTARLQSLFKMFGLSDRMVSNLEDIAKLSPINYVDVYKNYGALQNNSRDYLNNQLNPKRLCQK